MSRNSSSGSLQQQQQQQQALAVRSSAQPQRAYGGNSGIRLDQAPSSINISDHGVVFQVRSKKNWCQVACM
jgi:hypothetical protein